MIQIFAIGLSLIGLFLSSWILIPAPTYFWLVLSVGTPEVSPWLIGLNGIALTVGLLCRKLMPWPYVWIAVSMAALVMSALPLSQLPSTIQSSNQALERLYDPQTESVLRKPLTPWRSRPFQLVDAFFGISLPKVRHFKDIVVPIDSKNQLDLELYLPVAQGNYPAVISIYGGSWQRGSASANAQFNQYIAAQGYAVWAIDYRHAPTYQFPTQLDDVKTAIDYIQTHAKNYETQPDQLALIGRSAGAHLAMLAAFQKENPAVRGVIGFYGPVDLIEGYKNPPNPDPINSRSVLEDFLGGTPTEDPEKYRAASPLFYATKPQPPTLLIYGGRDNIVRSQYGKQLFEALDASGSETAFLQLPWADHAFDAVFNGISSQFSMYYSERFLAWVFQRA